MKIRISLIFVVISFLIMMSFYVPYIIESDFKYRYVNMIRMSAPYLLILSILIHIYYRPIKHLIDRFLLSVLFCFLALLLGRANNYYVNHYRQSLSKTSTYYMNTAVWRHELYKGRFNSFSETWCFSVQTGREIRCNGHFKMGDTVIVKMSLGNFILSVSDFYPSHADIQKYMEPVLFLNGEEQPRPKYSDADFSNDERRLYMYLSHPQIVKVVSKRKDEFLRNLVTLQINDTTQITVNLMYKDVMSYVDENDLDKVFNSIDVNGRGVIAKVSNINPRVVEVTKWNPTGTDYSIAFDRKTQVDTALENELMKKSVKQLGYIINKHKEESWTSRHKKKVKYFATVCVNDTIDRTFEIMGKDNYAIYNSIEQGDAVLVRVSEIFQYAVRILNWQPKHNEIEKYRIPVQFVETKK